MGLDSKDALPTGISAADAYSRIREWYQANVTKLRDRKDDYAKKSIAYIKAMPASPSADQMQDTFKQVLAGLLEWAYHESDGEFKMAAYARAATK